MSDYVLQMIEVQSSVIMELTEVNKSLLLELEQYRTVEENNQILTMMKDIEEKREELKRLVF